MRCRSRHARLLVFCKPTIPLPIDEFIRRRFGHALPPDATIWFAVRNAQGNSRSQNRLRPAGRTSPPEPGPPQAAFSPPKGPALENVSETPQRPYKDDEIIPTIQATEDVLAAEPSYPNDQSAGIYVSPGAGKRRAVAIKAASRNAAEVMQSA